MRFKIPSNHLNIHQSSLDPLKACQNILYFMKAFRIASMLWKLLTITLVLWTPVGFFRCFARLSQTYKLWTSVRIFWVLWTSFTI